MAPVAHQQADRHRPGVGDRKNSGDESVPVDWRPTVASREVRGWEEVHDREAERRGGVADRVHERIL